MKKLRLRKEVKNILVAILFYGLIVFGVISINDRYEQLCEDGYTQYCSIEK